MNPDKLSRIAALRPAAGNHLAPQPLTGQRSVQAFRLSELLGGELRANPHGSFLAVKRELDEPKPFLIGSRALKILSAKALPVSADPHRWLFLDTETTGLAGGTGTYAFLVGIAWWEDGKFKIEQLFMRDHCEERSLLHEIRRAIELRPILVTFNGKSFDWPLLETRFRMARIDPAGILLDHLDLLHPARQMWRYRMRSVALVELERHILDLDRGYDIASDTIPQRYFQFLRGGPAEPVAEIFHHNQMDLRGLAFLAERMVGKLEEPESQSEATELFGISRLLQKRGEKQLAGLCYQRALAGGLAEAPGRTAMRELAAIAKQRGDFSQAASLWQELQGFAHEGFQACVELAKFYEHREKDIAQAARYTREALASLRESRNAGRLTAEQYARRHSELQHRLTRLLGKDDPLRRCP